MPVPANDNAPSFVTFARACTQSTPPVRRVSVTTFMVLEKTASPNEWDGNFLPLLSSVTSPHIRWSPERRKVPSRDPPAFSRAFQKREPHPSPLQFAFFSNCDTADIVDEMKAEMTSNGFVVAKLPSRCSVVANTNGFNDTAEALPVRSSC